MSATIAPSVIAADIAGFGEVLRAVEPSAARWHVDVMDGHYVPNLTIGPAHVEAIAAQSALPQDVHLMITNPDETWEWYAKAGAARIGFHPETSADARALLRRLRDAGIGPGIAVNPDVPGETALEYADVVDHFIVMTVHPGFSGQQFIDAVLPKLAWLRERVGGGVDLIVDGGVTTTTAPACLEAGANVLVSASAIFNAPDPARAARALKAIADGS